MIGGGAEEISCCFELLGGFLEIEDVDPVLFADDKRLHAGVPFTALVTKVDACFDEFLKEF